MLRTCRSCRLVFFLLCSRAVWMIFAVLRPARTPNSGKILVYLRKHIWQSLPGNKSLAIADPRSTSDVQYWHIRYSSKNVGQRFCWKTHVHSGRWSCSREQEAPCEEDPNSLGLLRSIPADRTTGNKTVEKRSDYVQEANYARKKLVGSCDTQKMPFSVCMPCSKDRKAFLKGAFMLQRAVKFCFSLKYLSTTFQNFENKCWPLSTPRKKKMSAIPEIFGKLPALRVGQLKVPRQLGTKCEPLIL